MATVPLASAVLRRLEGKVALITGGAEGIGEATARLFSNHGAKVVIADIQDDRGHSICQELHKSSASYVHCDVTNEKDIETAVNTTVSKVMIPARRGSIINTASVAGNIAGTTTHAYTSSKHGVVGLTRNTAVELGPFGIRVNCVSPYIVLTPMAKKFLKVDDDGILGVYSNLKGTNLMPNDVAEANLYLGSDESKYVSGHNLVVDGGFTVVNNGFCVFGQSV
ncbi:unnamed protein product [Vicia faba]|uniref:Uncharacterized protein n=1 Tax=Vicia faba TaxID=3906 RepID=A0AAV1B0D8_VICFA|nr:unnamed protein product [Vicia faba]